MEKELLKKDVIFGNFTSSRYQQGSELVWDDTSYKVYPSRNEFGKNLFIVYDGVLRQFRIKEVVVFPFNWGVRKCNASGNYANVTTIEVAGVGLLNVGLYMYGGEFNCPIYESIEDYKNGNPYKMHYTRVGKEGCEQRYGIKFSNRDIFGRSSLQRWFWSGTNSYLAEIYLQMPICYLVEKDGIEMPDGWSPKELNGYATKEECEEDNSINICCFDDEEQPKKFTIKAEAVFSREIEVAARSREEAIEKLKAEFRFKEEDNNGTQFF